MAASSSCASPLPIDVVIVGGGLSGLVAASLLEEEQSKEKKRTWLLLEAHNSQFGGRIRNSERGEIDLGPAWLWPEHGQHKIANLCRKHNVAIFAQPDDSNSSRIVGGTAKLIDALVQSLPSHKLHLNAPVVEIVHHADADSKEDPTNLDRITIRLATGASFQAKQVILAIPPRLASERITFTPLLSQAKRRAMADSRTWMAGVTKVAVVYSTVFWPQQRGITNTGLPRFGGKTPEPAFQVYDGSSWKGKTPALTFFAIAGVDVLSPSEDNDKLLAAQCVLQLQKLWSMRQMDPTLIEKLGAFSTFHVQRWPLEPYISDDKAPTFVHAHPQPTLALSTPEWKGRLFFAGTETDNQSPGVMEGAINAAYRVVQQQLR